MEDKKAENDSYRNKYKEEIEIRLHSLSNKVLKVFAMPILISIGFLFHYGFDELRDAEKVDFDQSAQIDEIKEQVGDMRVLVEKISKDEHLHQPHVEHNAACVCVFQDVSSNKPHLLCDLEKAECDEEGAASCEKENPGYVCGVQNLRKLVRTM